MWLTPGPEPGHLAVVTETGLAASVTESAGHIWAELARRYGHSVMLLEHHPPPELAEGMETLDLVRVGTDGAPHWTRVWPTRRRIPVTPGWSCGWPAYGYQIVGGPAGAFDRCEDEEGPDS